jgi:carboxyl-terminal processing protease
MQALIMSLRRSLVAIAILAIAGFAAFYPKPDPKQKEEFIIQAVLAAMEGMHFSPKEINDEFSVKLYEEYLEELDPGKRFLTQTQIDQLEPYRSLLDDQIKAGDQSFFNLSVQLLDEGITKAEKYYAKYKDQDFDFASEEYYELDEEKRPWAANDAELEDYWRKTIKYEVLIRLDEKLSDEKNEDKTREELLEESRKQVVKIFDDWLDRTKDLRREDRFEIFVNTITHRFDPHSDYFNPKEKEDFDIRMSGRLEGIGARLQTEGEYTKVVSIVPGGPAWKQKELEVNDLITTVKQADSDPVDVTGMRIDDVVKMIRGDKGTLVTLTVKKVDGTFKDITIERDEVIIDEGFAKSLILTHEGFEDKIGYINLPGFYADFEGKGGPNSADDIKKELEKLKAEKVDGIILDLRNNGGGSLREVVNMSGLFIEKGPVVQVMSRGYKPYVYQDTDKSVTYNGPLVVLVNRFSASASEILAAALQDYKRAVIVGSNTTFGKGTVQRFFDMDRLVSNVPSDVKPLGEIKVTTQKYYRIDGGSVQLKGVTPDIILPDSYHYIRTGEQDYKNAMEWSEIEAQEFSQNVWQPKNMGLIRKQSAKRMQNDTVCARIFENAERLKALQDESRVPMRLEEYTTMMEKRQEEAKQFDKLGKTPIEGIVVMNPPVDTNYIQSDSSRIARNDNWIKNVHRDFQLNEAMHIMFDLIAQYPKLTQKDQ